MKCPECKSDTVVRKTQQVNQSIIRRYRRCLSCKQRITTIELPTHLHHTTTELSPAILADIRHKAQDLLDTIEAHDTANGS